MGDRISSFWEDGLLVAMSTRELNSIQSEAGRWEVENKLQSRCPCCLPSNLPERSHGLVPRSLVTRSLPPLPFRPLLGCSRPPVGSLRPSSFSSASSLSSQEEPEC